VILLPIAVPKAHRRIAVLDYRMTVVTVLLSNEVFAL